MYIISHPKEEIQWSPNENAAKAIKGCYRLISDVSIDLSSNELCVCVCVHAHAHRLMCLMCFLLHACRSSTLTTWRMKSMNSYKSSRRRATGLFSTLSVSTDTQIEICNKHRAQITSNQITVRGHTHFILLLSHLQHTHTHTETQVRT